MSMDDAPQGRVGGGAPAGEATHGPYAPTMAGSVPVLDPPADEGQAAGDLESRLRPTRRGIDAARLSDFVGGRALAWLGGIATLQGIVLLLALAIAHGWIGHEMRILLATGGCLVLMGVGSGCMLTVAARKPR